MSIGRTNGKNAKNIDRPPRDMPAKIINDEKTCEYGIMFKCKRQDAKTAQCTARYHDRRRQTLQGYVRSGIPVPGLPLVGVPNFPKCPVPVLRSYRIYRSVGHRYWLRIELTQVLGIGIESVPNKYPYPGYTLAWPYQIHP